jgi:CBS domain containing-hemolysin-like protein
MTILILLILVPVLYLCSAFFSGAETGFYRLSRFRLRLGVEQHRPFYKQLSHAVKDGQGLILSLLLGNNLVNYLATTFTAWILLGLLQDESLVEFLTTAMIAPSLFIFGEIIPKSVFFYRADVFMGAMAPAIWGTWRIFTASGAIRFLRWLLQIFSKLLGVSVDTAAAVDVTQRSQVRQLLAETREEGRLSSMQKDMMQRLANIPEVSTGSIMTPIHKVEMIEVASSRNDLMQVLARCSYRRIFVYQKDRNNILGYVDIEQFLVNPSESADIKKSITPLFRLNVSSSVLDAISLLRKGQHPIAAVTADSASDGRESRKILGILTLKDLVEELTGELAGYDPVIKSDRHKSPQ